MKSYDLVYIVRADLDPDGVRAVVERMNQRIADHGGTVEAVGVWGKRRLAFAARKTREGIFVHTRFALDPAKVGEIRRSAALTEEVLRAMITSAVGKPPQPKGAEGAERAAPPAEVESPAAPAEA